MLMLCSSGPLRAACAGEIDASNLNMFQGLGQTRALKGRQRVGMLSTDTWHCSPEATAASKQPLCRSALTFDVQRSFKTFQPLGESFEHGSTFHDNVGLLLSFRMLPWDC